MRLYEASSHLPDPMTDPRQLTWKTQILYETQHNPANLPHPRNHVTFTCSAIFHTERNETC
jgi:hypothetical protein